MLEINEIPMADATKATPPDSPYGLTALLHGEKDRMLARSNGEPRRDVKFTVLERLLGELDQNIPFDTVWQKLQPFERHALITRLENCAMSPDQKARKESAALRTDVVHPLSRELYGVIVNEDGEEEISMERKFTLEKELQDINRNLGLLR